MALSVRKVMGNDFSRIFAVEKVTGNFFMISYVFVNGKDRRKLKKKILSLNLKFLMIFHTVFWPCEKPWKITIFLIVMGWDVTCYAFHLIHDEPFFFSYSLLYTYSQKRFPLYVINIKNKIIIFLRICYTQKF